MRSQKFLSLQNEQLADLSVTLLRRRPSPFTTSLVTSPNMPLVKTRKSLIRRPNGIFDYGQRFSELFGLSARKLARTPSAANIRGVEDTICLSNTIGPEKQPTHRRVFGI